MKKNTILVCGDIHGRKFWKEPCKNIDDYEKVVFLGDYLDPYDFEGISVEESIDNFKEIIDLKKNNMDKVVLLLGNHDMPYFSDKYYSFSSWHCRHSTMYHNEIHNLFAENKDKFQISYPYDDILFTHAGVESGWLENVVKCDKTLIKEISDTINQLLETTKGLGELYMITYERGGSNKYGSCIWADIHDILWDIESLKSPDTIIKPIHKIKQIFGHTLQAYYDLDRNIAYGEAIEFENCKMLDTTNAYVLNTDTFKIEKVTI